MQEPERSARRAVDAVALAQMRRRLERAAEPPWLHGEVARRMAERLPVVRLQPSRVLQWPGFLGASAALLHGQYPQAQLVAVERGRAQRPPPDASAVPWWSPRRWAGGRASAPVLHEEQVEPGQAQLVWSNMALHGAPDPQAVMRRWQQALAVDGFLMFSTLGPGSLRTLSSLYRERGLPAPLAPFVDMHDLGDMLVEAGFADPVMDQETLTLTWATPAAALAELRGLGGNADPARHGALRTPRWRARLEAALSERAQRDGRIALDFEIVYGHAFRPPPRHKLAAQTELPLADLRAMVRARRGTRSP